MNNTVVRQCSDLVSIVSSEIADGNRSNRKWHFMLLDFRWSNFRSFFFIDRKLSIPSVHDHEIISGSHSQIHFVAVIQLAQRQ